MFNKPQYCYFFFFFFFFLENVEFSDDKKLQTIDKNPFSKSTIKSFRIL